MHPQPLPRYGAIAPIEDRRTRALLNLGNALRTEAYQFTPITPSTHARVIGREQITEAQSLNDIFGWSRSFRPDRFKAITELLTEAEELDRTDGFARSKVRFATLFDQLYVHSAYPTDAADAVFFGPDTYRFARVIKQHLDGIRSPTRIVDIGCGSGVGGIFAASLVRGDRPNVVLVDINDKALRYSAVNCAVNGSHDAATFVKSDLFESVNGRADLIISNPPYLVDAGARAYRHGGQRGFDLSLRIALESLERLRPGGRLILYTGTPVVRGIDQFKLALSELFAKRAQTFVYEEVDPDVFGEELENEAYFHADRIAVVVVVADLPQESE
jgi:methylase of polypeptide subunit release factors